MSPTRARRPSWTWQFLRHGAPGFGTIERYAEPGAGAQSLAAFIASQVSPSVTWDDLGWMRDAWDGPLVVKGLTSVEDCKLAKARGADGVLLSTHGGRNFDPAPAPIDVLPAVRQAVGDDFVGDARQRHPPRRGHRQGHRPGRRLLHGRPRGPSMAWPLPGAPAPTAPSPFSGTSSTGSSASRGHPDIKTLRQAETTAGRRAEAG